MSACVLDASAVLAYAYREKGAARVESSGFTHEIFQ